MGTLTYHLSKLGLEDLNVGYGTVSQIRGATPVILNKFNAHNLTYAGSLVATDVGNALDELASGKQDSLTITPFAESLLDDADAATMLATLLVPYLPSLPSLSPVNGETLVYNSVTGKYESSLITGLADPMTTRGDIIYRDPTNTTARLGRGTNGQVIGTDGTDIFWTNNPAGFADPMTTAGDLIIRNSGNVTTRLGIGTEGQVLVVSGGVPAWADGIEQLSAPTINSPADTTKNNPVVYTISDIVQVGIGTRTITLDMGTTAIDTPTSSEGVATIDGQYVVVTGVTSTSITAGANYTSSGTFTTQARQNSTDANYSLSNWSTADSIAVLLDTPTTNSPADTTTLTDVSYVLSDIDTQGDKIVFDAQSTDFTITSVSSGVANKVGTTVEITGYTAPVTLVLQYTVAATYNNRVKVIDTGTIYPDSAWSVVDSIIISAPSTATMDVEVYTGSGIDEIVNMANISGPVNDLWIKSLTSANSHIRVDDLRGNAEALRPDEILNFYTLSPAITFGTGQVTIPNGDGNINISGRTFVLFAWSLPNSNASNTNGTITTSTKYNDYKCLVKYIGNVTAGATIGHDLGKIPEFMIIKNRTSTGTNWIVYHKNVGATAFYYLDDTVAPVTATNRLNDTAPSSTVITLGDSQVTNENLAELYADIYATVADKCFVGSYVGNGPTAVPVNCNFTSGSIAVMIKKRGVGSWRLLNSDRGGTKVIYPNANSVEGTEGGVDFTTATGFTVIDTTADLNDNGATYDFIAFSPNA